jgi:hypothetical protein
MPLLVRPNFSLTILAATARMCVSLLVFSTEPVYNQIRQNIRAAYFYRASFERGCRPLVSGYSKRLSMQWERP